MWTRSWPQLVINRPPAQEDYRFESAMLLLLSLVAKFYYYALLLSGLCPAPADVATWQFRPSRLYLAYSVLVQCVCVALVPLTYSPHTYTEGFLALHPFMVILYHVESGLLILAIATHLYTIWARRAAIIRVCEAFRAIFKRYRHLGRTPRFRRTQRRIELLMVAKFGTSTVQAALYSLLFARLNPSREHSFVRVTVVSFALTQFLSNASGCYLIAALQIYGHFTSVNEELEALLQQAKVCERRRPDADPDQALATERWLRGRLQSLIDMHFDCYRFAEDLIDAFHWSTASVATMMLFSNIVVVYLVVVIANHRNEIELTTLVICAALMVVFYVDSMALTDIIEGMVQSCSATGQVLREYSELCHQQRVSARPLSRTMEQFVLQLTCRRLRFRVCGLFDYGRQMGLRSTITAILQVTVLWQYDLKLDALRTWATQAATT